MNINIDICDILSEDEIKSAAMEAIKGMVVKQFSGSEEKLHRLITNLCYDFVFEMVNRQFDGKLAELIKAKVPVIIDGLSSYHVFRRKDAWDKEDSTAYKILQEEMMSSHPLIRARVEQIIQEYPFEELKRDEIGDVVYQCIMDRLFPPREGNGD